jgi:hypothetical protein
MPWRGWWRHVVFLLVLNRRLYVFGASTSLFLHLAESAFHPLYVVVDLRRPLNKRIVRVHTVSMHGIAMVELLFSFKSQ